MHPSRPQPETGRVVPPSRTTRSRTPARRPKFSALSNARMEALGVEPMPGLKEALRDYFKRRPPLSVETAG